MGKQKKKLHKGRKGNPSPIDNDTVDCNACLVKGGGKRTKNKKKYRQLSQHPSNDSSYDNDGSSHASFADDYAFRQSLIG